MIDSVQGHCAQANSDQAARFVRESGIAQRQRDRCLAVVQLSPGLTAREIEARIGIKAHKRLPELRAAGLVCNGPTRDCLISQRPAMTWIPAHNSN